MEKRLAILPKNMLKEWPKRLYKNQTKTKVKTAKWVTLRDKQAPELDVAGRVDNEVADEPGSDQDRVTGALLMAFSVEWNGRQPNWRQSKIELEAHLMNSEMKEEYGTGCAPSFGVRSKMMYLLILDEWNLSIT